MQIIQTLHLEPGDAPIEATNHKYPVIRLDGGTLGGIGVHLTDMPAAERVDWLRESAANLLALAELLEVAALQERVA